MSATSQYFLEKKIARGGMAEIWLARQIGGDGFQRICAVKRILPHYADDAEYVQMFRDEAQICKSLRHNNIVRVEGFQAFGTSWGMVMEYVEGTDLRALLHYCSQRQMRLPVPMVLLIVAEAARGLHYAHTKFDELSGKHMNIVHRDISPQNILLSFSGEVKITDFGIADAGGKITDTRPGVVKGKYSYMSPEQVSAKPLDGRSDVFSLGIVLWESLSMTRLFERDSDVETIRMVHECRVPPTLRGLNSDVDQVLEQITMRALQRDIHRRYENSHEFERDLRRYLSHRYPEFTAEDVAKFLSVLLAQRKADIAADIRTLLSQPVPPTPPVQTNSGIRPINGSATGTGARQSGVPDSEIPWRMHSPNWQGRSAIRSTISMRHSPAFGRRGTSRVWIYAMIILGGLAGMLQLGRMSVPLTAKQPAQLVIKSNAPTLQISVNNKPMFDGRYRKIPLAMRLPPGRHMIQAKREGYYSEQTWQEIKAGAVLEEIKLQMKPKVEFVPFGISVRWSANPSIVVNIDDGYLILRMNVQDGVESPVEVLKDLAPGKEYNLRASVADGGTPKDISCRFTPQKNQNGKLQILTVDFLAGNCVIYER